MKDQVEEVRLQEKMGAVGVHYYKRKLFELTSKAVRDKSEEKLQKTKCTREAIEELNETNAHVKVSKLGKKSNLCFSE